MNSNTKICGLVWLIACGCTQRPPPPSDFSERLATADRVVVTYPSSPPFVTYTSSPSFTYSVTGEEVGRLVQAVTKAKEDVRFRAQAAFLWNVQFYGSTNLLGNVHMQGQVFTIQDKEYSDDSGSLNTFYQKMVSKKDADESSPLKK